MGYNDYQSKINTIYDNEDRNQLAQLCQKYSTIPDYKNMSLRDELQTRFDLNEMNDLQKKFVNGTEVCHTRQSLYSTPQPKRFSTGEIIRSGIEGFGQGVAGAVEHGVNTASLGLYDVLQDSIFNGGYEKRQNELKSLAEQENLGKAYKYSNYVIDAAVNSLTANKGWPLTKKLIAKFK